jgi:hypothetical protein
MAPLTNTIELARPVVLKASWQTASRLAPFEDVEPLDRLTARISSWRRDGVGDRIGPGPIQRSHPEHQAIPE